MKSKLLFVISIMVCVVMVPATMVHATVLYSETFDVGTTEGQSVQASPLNWVGGWGNPYNLLVASNLHSGWTTRAIDGSSGIPGTTNYEFKQMISMPTSGTFTVSWDAWADNSTAGDATMGAQGSNVGLGSAVSSGYGVAWEPRWADYGHLQWGFDLNTSLVASNSSYVLPQDIGMGATVTLKVFVDMDNKKIWGSLTTAGSTYVTPQYNITVANPNVSVFGLASELGGDDSTPGFRTGIDIDNVTVQTGIAALGSIGGNITLEDYSGDLSLAPVRVDLVQGGLVVKSQTVTLLTNPGSYTVAGVSPGVYDVGFSTSQWVKGVVSSQTVAGAVNTPISVSLPNGNVDGDSAVTTTDLSVVIKNLH